ncbi:unnamed protein product, partial [marine sediment metagenome]
CEGTCNDSTCECGETTANCWEDCGTSCGDGTCNGGEDTCNCWEDCGTDCGDGCCNGSEDFGSCPADCNCIPSNHSEEFSSAPAGWTVIDGGESTGDTWAIGTGPGYCYSGSCAFVDSDTWGDGTRLAETLFSPQYNLNGCSAATVGFIHYYNSIESGDYAEFAVQTDLMSWTVLQTWTSDAYPDVTESYDISAYLAGASWVQFRWYYDDDDTWAWYWHVDNFTLSIF